LRLYYTALCYNSTALHLFTSRCPQLVFHGLLNPGNTNADSRLVFREVGSCHSKFKASACASALQSRTCCTWIGNVLHGDGV
jgi:hypothetical protein